MALLKRKRVLAAKVEATIGTAETLTASEAAFNVYDLMIQPTFEMEARPGQGSFGQRAAVSSMYQGTATFKTEVGWDGTATVPTWASVFLPACGWVNSSGTFTPRSEAPGTNVKTLTIGAYIDGVKKAIAGAVGNFRWVNPTGKMSFIEWTFQGIWVAPSDVAILAPTYPTVATYRYASAATSIGGDALCVENVTVDSGNVITPRMCGTTASGIESFLITDRLPKITANPEAKLVATRDSYGDWLAGTEAVFSLALAGAGGAEIELTAPKAQYQNIQEGDRNGLVTDDLEFNCNQNGSTKDQELSLIFTPAA